MSEPRQAWSCRRSGAEEPRAQTCQCGECVCASAHVCEYRSPESSRLPTQSTVGAEKRRQGRTKD